MLLKPRAIAPRHPQIVPLPAIAKPPELQIAKPAAPNKKLDKQRNEAIAPLFNNLPHSSLPRSPKLYPLLPLHLRLLERSTSLRSIRLLLL
jgi:hypothetical protein